MGDVEVDNCLKKKVYRTKKAALAALKHVNSTSKFTFEIYECPVCYNFHLTIIGHAPQAMKARKPRRSSGDERRDSVHQQAHKEHGQAF